MIRRPPRSTQSRSSAASDVYKRQHVLWLAGIGAVDDALYLLELFHEVVLGVQPSGCVDEQQVVVAGLAELRAVEGHRRRVAVVGAGDRRDAEALAPDRQLGATGGPKGVAGGEHHLAPVAAVVGAELGDGRG